jgi:hypothetical protein
MVWQLKIFGDLMKNMIGTRELGRNTIKATLSDEAWTQNTYFTNELKGMIASHRLMTHPMINILNSGKLSEDAVKLFHIEFYFAFAQVFTDAIVTAMASASELEARLGPMGKVSARFLLQLNLLDELGFEPCDDGFGEHKGDPGLAHYIEFHKVLKQLGITADTLRAHVPSEIARKGRATYEDTYGDYLMTIGLLAAAENIFTVFAGPWSRSVALSTSIDTKVGYHSIHVADEDGSFLDDDHSEDTWYLVRQALTAERKSELKQKMLGWLDAWSEYLDYQQKSCLSISQPSLQDNAFAQKNHAHEVSDVSVH